MRVVRLNLEEREKNETPLDLSAFLVGRLRDLAFVSREKRRRSFVDRLWVRLRPSVDGRVDSTVEGRLEVDEDEDGARDVRVYFVSGWGGS